MKTSVLSIGLLWLSTVKAACDACLNNVCYVRKKLFHAGLLQGQLAIDRMDNILHFCYKDYRAFDYTAFLDLDFERHKPYLLPVDYSFARALNPDTGDVFFSGSRGIYVYKPRTKQTRKFGFFNKTIWHMQYNKKLYFSEYRKGGLHYIDLSYTGTIPALSDYVVEDFIIDRFDDIYFISDNILHRYKKGDSKPTIFGNTLFSLLTDTYDNAYFIETEPKTLYKMDYVKDRIKQIGIFNSGKVFRAVFDKYNNLIYTDMISNKIYTIRPNYTKCYVTQPF